jgi:four helix bundle protein
MLADFAPVSAAAAPDVAPFFAGAALLDAEKLDCYRPAIGFQTLAAQLLPRRGASALRDQLDRASVSIVLNIAEGAGRFSPADKARFYAIARGSATECAAIMDVVLSRALTTASTYHCGRSLLVRIVQMLTRLAAEMAARQSRHEP